MFKQTCKWIYENIECEISYISNKIKLIISIQFFSLSSCAMKRDEGGLDAAKFRDVNSVTQFQMATACFGVSGKAHWHWWVREGLVLSLLEQDLKKRCPGGFNNPGWKSTSLVWCPTLNGSYLVLSRLKKKEIMFILYRDIWVLLQKAFYM